MQSTTGGAQVYDAPDVDFNSARMGGAMAYALPPRRERNTAQGGAMVYDAPLAPLPAPTPRIRMADLDISPSPIARTVIEAAAYAHPQATEREPFETTIRMASGPPSQNRLGLREAEIARKRRMALVGHRAAGAVYHAGRAEAAARSGGHDGRYGGTIHAFRIHSAQQCGSDRRKSHSGRSHKRLAVAQTGAKGSAQGKAHSGGSRADRNQDSGNCRADRYHVCITRHTANGHACRTEPRTIRGDCRANHVTRHRSACRTDTGDTA